MNDGRLEYSSANVCTHCLRIAAGGTSSLYFLAVFALGWARRGVMSKSPYIGERPCNGKFYVSTWRVFLDEISIYNGEL